MAEVNLKIEQYEGPLDLLLALISKHKIDIFDIPIAEICEQYNAYLDSMQKLDMEVAGEFIVMAAELMLIKSKMLLPRPEDSEDPRKVLVDALLEHQRAKLAADYLKKQADIYFDRFTKPAEEQTDPTYHREHAVSLLQEAFDRITLRLEAERAQKQEVKLFKSLHEERFYTVEEKMELLTDTLRRIP
ncbi:MAG: segregation/condensation protein A, partial [Clostridia bacterium]|nr:segregation/condensation protein A [Clostridia bacterium]